MPYYYCLSKSYVKTLSPTLSILARSEYGAMHVCGKITRIAIGICVSTDGQQYRCAFLL